jgi:hypothetical protein
MVYKITWFIQSCHIAHEDFCGMKFLPGRSMLRLFKRFSIAPKEENRVFQSIRAIVVLLLVLSFQAAIVYIMVSSLP